jgi:ADP-ribose pyrophosphatase
MRVDRIEVISDQVVGREGGFLAIRRLQLANVRDDGTRSPTYLCDYVVRPKGIDAIVVAVWTRARGGAHVLLRDGMRAPLFFGRPADEGRGFFFREVVAGIVENEDVELGEEGLRRRGAIEVEEEAGYRVDWTDVKLLGAGTFPSPGAMAEKFWLAAVEISDPTAVAHAMGDGSPMEEGSAVEWLALDEAIAACVAGKIEDAKTELVLRRLRDSLTR